MNWGLDGAFIEPSATTFGAFGVTSMLDTASLCDVKFPCLSGKETFHGFSVQKEPESSAAAIFGLVLRNGRWRRWDHDHGPRRDGAYASFASSDIRAGGGG